MGYISYSFARTKNGVVKGSFAEVINDSKHDFVVEERKPRELIAPYRGSVNVTMPEKPVSVPPVKLPPAPAPNTREWRIRERERGKKF